MGNACVRRKRISSKDTPRTVPNTSRHLDTVELHHFAPLADNYTSIQNRFRPKTILSNRAHGLTVLKSVGKTSYMSCVIQCLSNTQPFLDFFISGMHEKEFDPDSESNCTVTKEFGKLITNLWLGNEDLVNPTEFIDAVSTIESQYNTDIERDAHDFLIFMFDQFHNDLYRKASGLPGELKYRGDPIEIEAAKTWQDSLLTNSSIIVDLFQGQLRFKAQCKNCGKLTYHFDSYICLRFPVRNVMKSLNNCIQEFIDTSFAQQEMFCNHCNQTAVTDRRFEIWKFPPIMIVNLKTIDEEPRKTVLDYPIYGLDLSKLVSGPFKQTPKYDLFAFIKKPQNPKDEYSAVCRNRMNDQWYEFKNNRVMNYSSDNLISEQAYTLFYYNNEMTDFPRQFYNKPETWPHTIQTDLNIATDLKPKELENKGFFMDPYLVPSIKILPVQGFILEDNEETKDGIVSNLPNHIKSVSGNNKAAQASRDFGISRNGSFEFQIPPSHFFMHKLTHKGDISTPRVYLR